MTVYICTEKGLTFLIFLDDFHHLKRKSQCGEKKEEGNRTLPSKEKEHIIVTRQFPGSPLRLNTGVGCVTSVQICDYSHHLIKSHIDNLLSPAKVTDCTSNLLITGSFLVTSSTTEKKWPFMARWSHASIPSQRLCVHLCGLVAVHVLSD